MNQWARIEDGEVFEITNIDPAGRFHPSLEWVKCSDDVAFGWGYDGKKFTPPETPSAEDQAKSRRISALESIDSAAGNVRLSDRSLGSNLDAEYRFVYDALEEYRQDPDGKVPQAIKAHMEAHDVDIDEAAKDIAEAAGRDEDLLVDIRRIRLAGKLAVRKADDDFVSVAQPYLDQLNALQKEQNEKRYQYNDQ